MVVLYVKGQRIGTLAEVERTRPELFAGNEELEFCDESGSQLGKFARKVEPICPWHPEWTQADLDRMSKQGGGIPLAELLSRLGAQ